MKIKLDENLPFQIAPRLRSLGHDVHTTPEEGLSGSDDDHIWNATQREGRFLLTQDLDFSDARKFAPGTHYGIALIRLRAPNRDDLVTRTEQVFRFEDISTWPGSFVVVTEQKVRVRRGPDESAHRSPFS
jgi:predicted nuclease of predicted toxin-antitoxin system